MPFHWAFAGEVVGDNANDLTVARGRSQREHARVQGVRLPGPRRAGWAAGATADEDAGALADARADPRHAGGGPARREGSTMPNREQELARSALRQRPARAVLAALLRPPHRPVPPRRAARSRARRPASTPTPPSASAARRARSRASSGTSSPPTASSGPATATTTPGAVATSWRHVKFIEQFRRRTSCRRARSRPTASDRSNPLRPTAG